MYHTECFAKCWDTKQKILKSDSLLRLYGVKGLRAGDVKNAGCTVTGLSESNGFTCLFPRSALGAAVLPSALLCVIRILFLYVLLLPPPHHSAPVWYLYRLLVSLVLRLCVCQLLVLTSWCDGFCLLTIFFFSANDDNLVCMQNIFLKIPFHISNAHTVQAGCIGNSRVIVLYDLPHS